MQLRLIGNGYISFACGDKLRRVIGVRRGDKLHIKASFLEVTFFTRNDQRCVIRVDEPVQQDRHFVGGLRWRTDQSRRDQK